MKNVVFNTINDNYEKIAFIVDPEVLLSSLYGISPIGGNEHPNKYEIQAQIKLMEFYMKRGGRLERWDVEIFNDHWNKTFEAIVDLFDSGSCSLRIDNVIYSYSTVVIRTWDSGGTDPVGGREYLSEDGRHLFKVTNWMS